MSVLLAVIIAVYTVHCCVVYFHIITQYTVIQHILQ